MQSNFRSFFGAAVLLATSACGSESPTVDNLLGPDGEAPGSDAGVPGVDGAVPAADGSVVPGSDGSIPGTDGSIPGIDGSAGNFVDPTGVWWTEIETTGNQNLPTVGTLQGSKIRFVMRVEIAGTVPNQTAKFEFCQLQTEWENPLLPGDFHTIGFRPTAAAAFTETRSVDFSGLSVGDSIPVPDLTFIAGGDASGAILDEDGDGFPAITTWVRVILPFEVAEIITIDAKLDVVATDEDTLSGNLSFDVDAEILDSSNALFVPAGFPVTIVPDSDEIPITVRRMPAGGDCSAIPSTVQFSDIPPPQADPVDPIWGPSAPPAP